MEEKASIEAEKTRKMEEKLKAELVVKDETIADVCCVVVCFVCLVWFC